MHAQWAASEMLLIVIGTGLVLAGLLSTLIWVKTRTARKSYSGYPDLKSA